MPPMILSGTLHPRRPISRLPAPTRPWRHVRHPFLQMFVCLLCALLLLTPGVAARAADIHVPADYATIQDAIDAANPGDVVIVTDDTYTGAGNIDLDFGGKAITVRSASNDPSQCIIDCQQNGRGFHFQSGETASAVVSGFAIQNGSVDLGAGALCENNSSPTFTDCVFYNNSANQAGGGLDCDASSPTVTRCAFFANVSPIGGGLTAYKSLAALSNSLPVLTNCVFAGNIAYYGGGMYNATGGDPTATNCVFTGNFALGDGGGMFNDDDSAPTVINCTVYGNSAFGSGMGGGSGIVNTGLSSVTAINSILGDGVDGDFAVLSHCDVEFSSLPATPDANGNFNNDPLFADPANDDLHLTFGSPCIDRGDDAAIAGVTTDLDGNPRIVGAHVDVGAYEYQNVPPILNAIPDQTGTTGKSLTFTPTLAQAGNHTPLAYSLVNAPAGVTINSTTGQVTWTPTVAGTYTFSIMVTDSAGLSDTKPVTVKVNSDATVRLVVVDIAASRVNANTVRVTLSLSNVGTVPVQNALVTRGKLGNYNAQTPLPGPFSIAAGNKQSVTLTFTGASAIPSGYLPFTMGGTYQSSGGSSLSFSTGFNLNVP